MRQLFNNQLDHHATALGFPSVLACNAIVYQTATGLCGLHNYGGDSPHQYDARAAAFTAFAQQCNMLHAGQARNLYSVINIRYDTRNQESRQSWIAEMSTFARSLGFTGTIHLIKLIKHLDPGGSVYIQYDMLPGNAGCRIRYKKWSKMRETRVHDAPTGLRELKKDMQRWNNSMGTDLAYEAAAPQEVVDRVEFNNPGASFHEANRNDTDNSNRFTFSVA